MRIPPTIRMMAEHIGHTPTPAEALRLFMVAPRIPMARREAEDMSTANPFCIEEDGDRIQAWSFGQGPTTILTHGWGGRASQLATFALELERRGRRAILFDAPGHGDSEGELSTALRVAHCVHLIAEREGPIDSLVSHSFGVVGANIALHFGLQVRSVAYMAGLVWIPQRFLEWGYAVGLDEAGIAEYWRLSEEWFGPGRLDEICGDKIAPHMTARALIFHDDQDDEVDVAQAEALAGAGPGARLVKVDGLGHRRIIRSAEIVRQVADFVSSGTT